MFCSPACVYMSLINIITVNTCNEDGIFLFVEHHLPPKTDISQPHSKFVECLIMIYYIWLVMLTSFTKSITKLAIAHKAAYVSVIMYWR